MKAKVYKVAETLHTYCTTCIHSALKKNYIINNMGLARYNTKTI